MSSQDLRDFRPFLFDRFVERCLAVVVRERRVSASFEERLNYLDVAQCHV